MRPNVDIGDCEENFNPTSRGSAPGRGGNGERRPFLPSRRCGDVHREQRARRARRERRSLRDEPRPVDGKADRVAGCDIGACEASPLIPDYVVQKTVVTLSDPVSGPVMPKAIPGAVMQYTISLGNDGPGAADTGSIVISEALPPDTSLVVTDFDVANPGPVAFVDGVAASGLNCSFAGLGSAADDIQFSDDGGATYGYVPVPGADGSDPAVTHVRITPTGTVRFTGAVPVAEFLLKVVVR